jgi:ribose 5-phosphate isomerase B
VLIAIAADHAGYHLKEELKPFLRGLGHDWKDFGTNSTESVDYPDFAEQVARAVAEGLCPRGIVICGTGVGSAIAANKVAGVRAGLCHEPFSARHARLHNDANVLALGARVIGAGLAKDIVAAWLDAPFEGGRHARRVEKIRHIEERERGV